MPLGQSARSMKRWKDLEAGDVCRQYEHVFTHERIVNFITSRNILLKILENNEIISELKTRLL